jgi:NAD(P)-dependent dehydrogenase (short-subunit alcohol dehydrogenase family)
MKIIVVGATGTLGSAVVKALVSKGHEVIATSRKSEASVNLEDSASVEDLFAGARDVAAVVSCAGDAIFRPFSELTDADFALCVRSKMMGQVNLVRTAAKHLRDAGSVTITSGMASTHPTPGSAAISLVNAGLEGFVRAAALEMPRGIRVNAVCPGWVKETLVKFGMDPTLGLPAADYAKVYVKAVEGTDQGQIIQKA